VAQRGDSGQRKAQEYNSSVSSGGLIAIVAVPSIYLPVIEAIH